MAAPNSGKPARARVGFVGFEDEAPPRLSIDVIREEQGDTVPEMTGPSAKKKKAVLLKSDSMSSAGEQSVAASATSGASSGLFGGGGTEAAGLGLQILERDEWSKKETAQRQKVIPILKTTLGQIDGSIKPKYAGNQHQKVTKAQNMEEFGRMFYEELFEQAPALKDELFSSKPVDVLAIKLGLILSELIRLLEIESPRVLMGVITEMGLRHIEYGLEKQHVRPFRDVMVDTLKRCVTQKGHKWKVTTTKSWNWALEEIAGLLVQTVSKGRPMVDVLQRSWAFLCDRMHDEEILSNPARRRSVDVRTKKGYDPTGGRGNGNNGRNDEVEEDMIVHPTAAGPTVTVVSAYKTGGVKQALKHLVFGSEHANQESEGFSLWRKKLENNNPTYLEGRRAAGARFIEYFAAQNPWAVKQFEFGNSPHHPEKMGEALELFVKGATKPQILQHKLRVLSLSHVQMGITPDMFVHFERALFDFLAQSLGKYHMFTNETKEAWQWMYNIVVSAFTRSMHATKSSVKVMERSWEYIERSCDLHEVSDQFFEALFSTLPELQSFFTKPKKMQHLMFVKALDLIVRSTIETKVMEVDLKAIAMRHIKYDIRADHLEMFGTILLQTLGSAVGPGHWDEDDEAAWLDIYSNIALVFGHIISTGRNLVSKSLASGSLDDLATALACTARKKRVLAALEIDVDDSVISPLVWSIQEGQLQITNALLEDILAIRGDRDNYYYGRSLLWNRHPWIVQLLVEKAPNLLTTFLDGHMWTSKFLVNGHRRVNYYVQELYADPNLQQNSNVSSTPLGILVRQLPNSEVHVFAHPTIRFITDLKWEQFAMRDFLVLQSLNMAMLLLGTIFTQLGPDYPLTSFAMAILMTAMAAYRLLMLLHKTFKLLSSGGAPKRKIFGITYYVPHIFEDIFIFINFLTCIMILVLFYYTWKSDVFGWQVALSDDAHYVSKEEWLESHRELRGIMGSWSNIAAVATGLLWIQVVEIFKVTTRLSALLFSLSAVVSDVMRFVLVLMMWAAGFSITLYWLTVGKGLRSGEDLHDALQIDLGIEGYSDAGTLMYYVVMSCLGLTGIQVVMESNWLVRMVYAICVITTVVVILNLLVSTMVSTYETLNKSFHELAVKTRAELVIRAEDASSLKRRSKYYESCNFTEKVDFDDADDGPSGGIQVRLSAKLMQHPSFSVLDRVERYGGSSNPRDAWDQNDRIQSTISADASGGSNLRNNANNQMLRTIDTELQRLGSELYSIKASCTLKDDDGASSYKSSVQGDAEDGGSVKGDAGTTAGLYGDDANHEDEHDAKNEIPQEKETAEDKPKNLRVVAPQELSNHTSVESLWMIVDGIVRDATTVLGYHPGGKQVLLDNAGIDATAKFYEVHQGPSRTIASAMLKSLPIIGRLQGPEDDATLLPGAVQDFATAVEMVQSRNSRSPPAVKPIPNFQAALDIAAGDLAQGSVPEESSEPLGTARDVDLLF